MLWQKWVTELYKLVNFAVCRCVKPYDFVDVESAQLHHFADASNYGCGTATYLRLVGRNGIVHALEKHKQVKKDSSLFKLGPILEDGVLKVGGSLSRAVIPVEAKHPVILSYMLMCLSLFSTMPIWK